MMFGCSDVYHWMGRTAKAVCLPDCGRTYLQLSKVSSILLPEKPKRHLKWDKFDTLRGSFFKNPMIPRPLWR